MVTGAFVSGVTPCPHTSGVHSLFEAMSTLYNNNYGKNRPPICSLGEYENQLEVLNKTHEGNHVTETINLKLVM